MRLIGHLTSELTANRFSDFLYTEGIHSRLERERDGTYGVWVLEEDQLDRARGLLDQFNEEPDAPAIVKAAAAAGELRSRDQAAEEAAERRYFDRSRFVRPGRISGAGPLSVVLIIISVAVAILSQWGENREFTHDWYILMSHVMQGQLWRLVTPIFLHFSIIHLLFNMLWLYDLGSMIETRQGTLRFGVLVLVLAITSNLGQYYFSGPYFGGMSGVVYGLLGFVWLRGKTDPASGLFLHPQTVAMMVIWFFICLTGYAGSIANAAHGVGLAVGMAIGYLSGLQGRRS